MSYAQTDYPEEIIGQSGDSTIREAGALLVAFANLLRRAGQGVDPTMLNKSFIEDGTYLPRPDGVRDALTWGSITAFDPTMGIGGAGVGEPTHPDSIVKLEYDNKLTGGKAITYALVDSVENKTIIDSFDGQSKSWDIYGGPKEWVHYQVFPALEVTPLRAAAKPAEPTEEVETFHVVHQIPGYASSAEAAGGGTPTATALPGHYLIFNKMNGMLNLTKTPGQAGYWVNPKDNLDPNLVPADNEETKSEDDAEVVPVRIIPPNPLKWQQTYVAGLGPIECVAKTDVTVTDLAGENSDKLLAAGTPVLVAGRFEKDGRVYYRTTKSVERGHWYGIPKEAITRAPKIDEDELDRLLTENDDAFRQDMDLSARDKVIKAGATIEGKASKLKKILSIGKSK